MTQGETLEEVINMAKEARELWIECEYDTDPNDIPMPSYPIDYSGKLNVRIPKLLHQLLIDAAERDEISLDQYVTMLLTRGEAEDRVLLHAAQTRQYALERAAQKSKSEAV